MKDHPELVEKIIKPDGTQYKGAFKHPPSKKACSELRTNKWMLCHPTGERTVSHPTCRIDMSVTELSDLYNLHMTCHNMRVLENCSSCFDKDDDGHIQAQAQENEHATHCLELLYMTATKQNVTGSFYDAGMDKKNKPIQPSNIEKGNIPIQPSDIEKSNIPIQPSNIEKGNIPIQPSNIEKGNIPIQPPSTYRIQDVPRTQVPTHVENTLPISNQEIEIVSNELDSETDSDKEIDVESDVDSDSESIIIPRKKKKTSFWSNVGFYFLVLLTLFLLVIFFLYVI